MKKLMLLIIFFPLKTYGACPLYTYPENKKVDQDFNNLCDQLNNQTPNYVQATSGTYTSLSVTNLSYTNISPTPSGKLKQIVQVTTTAGTSTTSSSFQSTGLSATITPSSTNCKVMVQAFSNIEIGASNKAIFVSMFRGGTDLTDGVHVFTELNNSTGGDITTPDAMAFLDSPLTASATTYTVKIKNGDGATTASYGSGVTSVMDLWEFCP